MVFRGRGVLHREKCVIDRLTTIEPKFVDKKKREYYFLFTVSKKEGKYQRKIQSSTTPCTGYHMAK